MNTSTEKTLRSSLKGEVNEDLFRYVVENAHVIPFWSMERFCSRSGASEEQIYELMAAFGADSLNSFKTILRNVFYHETHDAGVAKRPISSIVSEMINNEKQNLNDLLRDMDYDKIDRLTREITTASEVVVIGGGGATPYSYYFNRMLSKLGIRTRRLENQHDLVTFMKLQDRSALVVAFGIARYSKDPILRVSRLRQQGYRVVAFTDRHDSPFVDLSEYYFFLPVQCFDFVDSYTAGMTLINAILLNLGLQDEKKLISQLDAYDALAEDMGLFF